MRLIADAAPDRCTLVTTADGADSTEFDQHLATARLRTEVIGSTSTDANRWFEAALAPTAAGSGRLVVVPDAEAALRPLLTTRIGRSTTVTAVLMRMNRGVGLRGSAVFVAKLLLAGWLRLRWREQLRILALVPAGTDACLPLRLVGVGLVHDPVRFQPASTDPQAARCHLGLPVGPPIFSVVGPLTGRKCVPELIEAWVTGGPPGLLLLVGIAQPEVVEAVRKAGPSDRSRIILRDQYVDDQDFDTYLAASDVAVLLYRNRGSSGVLGKALAADCDMIASTTTPAVRASGGRRVVRVPVLTVERIRAALVAWPGRRERRSQHVDHTAHFAKALLGEPV